MVSATYKILLEQTSDGQSSATVLEIPDCQAIAITPQEAISQVQTRLTDRLATAQIVSIQIPSPPTHNPWIEFSGIFQDDPDFAEIAKAIRAERISPEHKTKPVPMVAPIAAPLSQDDPDFAEIAKAIRVEFTSPENAPLS